MPDAVFDALISYSRQDQEFVRRLSAALQTRHIRTWVDWEGIPLSSKWLAEIEAQIEAANTFVFVVSPDSVASEICRAEIRHAAAYRKKIIPIVSRSVDPNATPAEIVEWQWLFFREQDDFDSACDDLAEAIHTDLDHVRLHTRLLVRAREWEDKGQQRSFVLRGKDLAEARNWLEGSREKKPAPTELHKRFLAASHRAARVARVLRDTAASLILVTGVVGYYYYGEWRRESLISRHETYANNLNLAEEAFLAGDYTGAVDRLRTEIPQEGEEDLREFAWRYLWSQFDSHHNTIFVSGKTTSIDISPDGRTLAITNESPLVTLWDLDTGKMAGKIQDPEFDVTAAEFVENGAKLLTGGEGTRLWDWADFGIDQPASAPGTPSSLGDSTRVLGASPDGSFVLRRDSGSVLRELYARHLETGEEFQPDMVTGKGDMAAFAYRPDSRELALAYSGNLIRRFSLPGGKETQMIPAGNPDVFDLCYPDDDLLALAVTEDGFHQIFVWDLRLGKERRRMQGPASDMGLMVALRCEPKTGKVALLLGSAIWSTSGQTEHSRLVVWEAEDGRHLFTIDGADSGFFTAFSFSLSGDQIATGSRDQSVRLWDADQGFQRAFLGIHHEALTRDEEAGNQHREADTIISESKLTGGGISHLEYSSDGRTIVTASHESGTVKVWDADGRQDRFVLPQRADFVTTIAMSPDGRRIVTGDRAGTVTIWNTDGYEKAAERDVGAPVSGLAFSTDGNSFVSATSDKKIRRWDADTLEELGTFIGPQESDDRWIWSDLAFGQDAVVAISTTSVRRDESPDISVWNLDEHRRAPDIETRGAAVTPDGSRLATLSGRCGLLLWNAVEGVPTVVSDSEHCDYDFEHVAISPDGQVLAVAGPVVAQQDDEEISGIRLFDLGEEGETILPLISGYSTDRAIQSLEFSPDSRFLATIGPADISIFSDDAAVTVWDVATGQNVAKLDLHGDEICDGFRAAACARLGAFSADGRSLAIVRGVRSPQAGRTEVIIWHWESGKQTTIASADRVDHVYFAPDSETLALLVASRDAQPAIIWDIQADRQIKTLGDYDARVGSMAEGSARLLAVTDEYTSTSGRVSRVWDMISGTRLLSESDLGDEATGPIVLSADGTRLEVGRKQGALIWDLAEGRMVSVLDEGAVPADVLGAKTTIGISPDGSIAVTAVRPDDRVLLWNAETGVLVDEIEGQPPLAFSPDGKRVAAQRDCDAVTLWNFDGEKLQFGQELNGLSTCVDNFVFGPDGDSILTMTSAGLPGLTGGIPQARIWDVRSGQAVEDLRGYEGAADGIAAISRDGKTIATATEDGAIDLWDPLTGRRLLTLAGPEKIAAMAFSASGSTLTAAYAHEMRSWTVSEQ